MYCVTPKDGIVVLWRIASLLQPLLTGEVSASRVGVLISNNWPIMGELAEVRAFGTLLEEAIICHKRLIAGDELDEYKNQAVVSF